MQAALGSLCIAVARCCQQLPELTLQSKPGAEADRQPMLKSTLASLGLTCSKPEQSPINFESKIGQTMQLTSRVPLLQERLQESTQGRAEQRCCKSLRKAAFRLICQPQTDRAGPLGILPGKRQNTSEHSRLDKAGPLAFYIAARKRESDEFQLWQGTRATTLSLRCRLTSIRAVPYVGKPNSRTT